MLTFLEVGFRGNSVQGLRAYAWRAVPSLPQIALCFPSFALRPQPFRSEIWKCFSVPLIVPKYFAIAIILIYKWFSLGGWFFEPDILAIFLLSPFIKAYCCVVTFSSLLSLLSMPFNAFCTLCSFGKWQLKENMKFKNIVQTNTLFTCNKRQHQRRQSLSLWLKPAPRKLLKKNMKPNK